MPVRVGYLTVYEGSRLQQRPSVTAVHLVGVVVLDPGGDDRRHHQRVLRSLGCRNRVVLMMSPRSDDIHVGHRRFDGCGKAVCNNHRLYHPLLVCLAQVRQRVIPHSRAPLRQPPGEAVYGLRTPLPGVHPLAAAGLLLQPQETPALPGQPPQQMRVPLEPVTPAALYSMAAAPQQPYAAAPARQQAASAQSVGQPAASHTTEARADPRPAGRATQVMLLL